MQRAAAIELNKKEEDRSCYLDFLTHDVINLIVFETDFPTQITLYYTSKKYQNVVKTYFDDIERSINKLTSWRENLTDKAAFLGYRRIIEWSIPFKGVQLSPLICDYAASGGQMKTIYWLFTKYHCEISDTTGEAAAMSGDLRTVIFLKTVLRRFTTKTFSCAAMSGNLELMKWLKDDGKCPWDYCTLEQTVIHGHVGNIEWLIDNNCPISDKVATFACITGNLPILQYLVKRRSPIDWLSCISNMIAGGYIHMLEWINTYPVIHGKYSLKTLQLTVYSPIGRCWISTCGFDAVEHDQLETLKWFKANGLVKLVEETSNLALSLNRLEILKWLKENDCPFSEGICSMASELGHFEILKWAKEEGGFSLGRYVLSDLALHGNLEMFQWARDNGCPWTPLVCANAASKGNWNILKWALENGCDQWGEKWIIANALENGHEDLVHNFKEWYANWCSSGKD